MSAENRFIHNLTSTELKEIIDIYSAAFSESKKITDNMDKSLLKLQEAYDFIQRVERNKDKRTRTAIAKDVAKRIVADYTEFIKDYIALYEIYSSIFGAVYDTQELRRKIEWDIVPAQIQTAATATTLMVHLPHMPVKTHYRASVLRDILKTQLDRLFGADMIPAIEKKIVRILHVYPSATRRWQLPDNDNYYIKDVIDIITDYIGGGDGCLTCSIILETVLTDELPEGSYIIVSPDNEGIEPKNTVLETLKITLNLG